jgi:hypothetical protein
MSHDTTCIECGLDRSLARERVVERVSNALHTSEHEQSKLRCRVTELEQVIRAFVTGKVNVQTLRAVAESA